MHRFRRLMVALARTDADPALLRYAAAVARLGTATEVRFVHVLPTDTPDPDANRALEEAHAEVRDHFTGVPGTVAGSFDVLRGPLLDQMLEYTSGQKIDLLLLGHRQDHPGRSALGRRLAMKATCSVWMIPEGSPATLDRILVPIDFSEHAADTLRVATEMAKLAGRDECVALHVYYDEAAITYEGHDELVRGREAEAFRQFLAPIDLQGVKVTPLFEEGANVGQAINRVAEREKCDLVVMATRGRSPSAALLLGSATEATIQETRVPLLVVKHFGAQIGFLRALWDKTVHRPNTTHF
jgi:SulP family sulfate permease